MKIKHPILLILFTILTLKWKIVISEEQTERLHSPVSILIFANIIEMEIDEFNHTGKSNPRQKPLYNSL